MVVLVGQEVQALVDTASDLNLIRKNIVDPLCLGPLFPARAATQAGGIPLKTIFQTRYRLFEYRVMPFGLSNTSASVQSYIKGFLKPYLDITVIVYLDNVLVFSRNLFQLEKYVREVLKALLKAELYAKLSKCLFSVTRIPFLGFILTDTSVEMEENRISTILNWPEPECVRDVQSFPEFANFYR